MSRRIRVDFLRFYLFWKWEYQRRNQGYIDDYKKLMDLASDVAKKTRKDVQKAIIGIDYFDPSIIQEWGDKIKKAMPSPIDWSGKLEDLPGLGWELYLNHICGINSVELVKELSAFEKKHQRDPTPPDSDLTAGQDHRKDNKGRRPRGPHRLARHLEGRPFSALCLNITGAGKTKSFFYEADPRTKTGVRHTQN